MALLSSVYWLYGDSVINITQDIFQAVAVLVLYTHNHNNTIIKQTSESVFRICTSHFIVRVRKGLLRVLLWEGVGDRTELQYFDPHLMAVSLVSFSFSRAAQPAAQRPTLLVFTTTSYQQLLWTSTHQGPQGSPQPGFLYHILSATSLDPNSSGPHGPLRPGVAFPTTLVSNSSTVTLSDFCLDWVI